MSHKLNLPKLYASLLYFNYILGTMIHEYGHLFISRILGYGAEIRYHALDKVYYTNQTPIGTDLTMIRLYGGFTLYVLYACLSLFINGEPEARIGIQTAMIYNLIYAVQEGIYGYMSPQCLIVILVAEILYLIHVFKVTSFK